VEGRRRAVTTPTLGAQSEVFRLMLRQVRNIRNIRHTVDFASVFLACCRNSIRNIRHGIRHIRNRSATGFPLKTLGCCACCGCCACGRGRGRDVSGPGVKEVRPFITLGRCLPDPHCSRLDAVLAKVSRKSALIQWLASHIPPRSFLDFLQLLQDYLGRELLCPAEHRLQMGQEQDSQARLGFLGNRNKRNSRNTRPSRPVSPRCISNGNQGFPYVGIAILNFWRQIIRQNDAVCMCLRPCFDQGPDSFAIDRMQPAPIWLNAFARLATAPTKRPRKS
jgi:hypothetical protein